MDAVLNPNRLFSYLKHQIHLLKIAQDFRSWNSIGWFHWRGFDFWFQIEQFWVLIHQFYHFLLEDLEQAWSFTSWECYRAQCSFTRVFVNVKHLLEIHLLTKRVASLTILFKHFQWNSNPFLTNLRNLCIHVQDWSLIDNTQPKHLLKVKFHSQRAVCFHQNLPKVNLWKFILSSLVLLKLTIFHS